jgi:nitrogen fixation protein FixH
VKRGALWPIGIIVILGVTVAVNIAVYYVANDDPSVAIEPDYYAKAVDWDSTMAQATRNAALGWHLTTALDPFSVRGGALLHVTLSDSAGIPIPDATVRVAALYNARANIVYDTTLSRDPGGYESQLPVHHGGQWELRFDVTRGATHFTSVARVEAVPAPPGP